MTVVIKIVSPRFDGSPGVSMSATEDGDEIGWMMTAAGALRLAEMLRLVAADCANAADFGLRPDGSLINPEGR